MQKWNNLFTFSRSKALGHFHSHLIICFSSTHTTWGLFLNFFYNNNPTCSRNWDTLFCTVCIKDSGRTDLLCVLRSKYSLCLKNIQPRAGHNPLTFKVSIPGLKLRSLHCMSQALEPTDLFQPSGTFMSSQFERKHLICIIPF